MLERYNIILNRHLSECGDIGRPAGGKTVEKKQVL